MGSLPGSDRKQPGFGQLPQPPANRLQLQPSDLAQQALGQRPSRDRQPSQDRPRVIAAAASAGRQQFRQPLRQGTRHAQPAPRRIGHSRGYQLLGEKRVALGPGIHVLHEQARRRPADQRGDLLRHLTARHRPQPDLLHSAASAHMRQPGSHPRVQRRLIAAARGHYRQRITSARPRQVRQAIQGRTVSPVHVLDHHGKPFSRGHRAQQLGHRRHQPLPPPRLVPATPAAHIACSQPG